MISYNLKGILMSLKAVYYWHKYDIVDGHRIRAGYCLSAYALNSSRLSSIGIECVVWMGNYNPSIYIDVYIYYHFEEKTG